MLVIPLDIAAVAIALFLPFVHGRRALGMLFGLGVSMLVAGVIQFIRSSTFSSKLTD